MWGLWWCWRSHHIATAVAELIVLVFVVVAIGDAVADALNRNAVAIVAREFSVFEADSSTPHRRR